MTSFRAPQITRMLCAVLAASTLSALCVERAKQKAVQFSKEPALNRAGNAWEIRFGVSRACDVIVAVLDAKGKVVRHVAAGMLGPNAPAPLKKGSLDQSLAWDGKDDLGNAAKGGPFTVRVAAGIKPRLEKMAGWNPKTLSRIFSMVVGPGGELFVLLSDSYHGRSEIRVFDRKGVYVRTIMPYPANTPKERTESIGHIITDAGERLPIVFQGHNHTLHPMTAGMKKQKMAWHPKGHLVMASAVGTMAEHGPPRHLLAMHPMGGAPEGLPFVGPEIMRPRGFMGGNAEGPSYYFDHLAVSPDGEWVYFALYKQQKEGEDPRRRVKPWHAVYRVKWTDKTLGKPFLGVAREAGSDDGHFKDPQGLAFDAKGNLYVCDHGNGRVMVFDGQGKLKGQFAVPNPQEIAVHPKTNVIYILSKKLGKRVKQSMLLKLEAWKGKAPAKLAELSLPDTDLIALDAEAEPTKLWTANARIKLIIPVTDEGGKLKAHEKINDNDIGLEFPLFVAADPARNRLIVREKPVRLFILDLETNVLKQSKIRGYDAAVDRDGNIYVMDGYGKNSLSRYTPSGKPLPFSGTKSHRIKAVYRGYGPNIGLRGHCVGLDGSVYVICSTNYGPAKTIGSRVHQFGPDGKMKKEALVNGLGYGDCGVGVDAKGNVYVGVNVKPKGKPFPEPFVGKVPAKRWIWWRRNADREKPWYYIYYNTYLFHIGTVFKFPPSGGTLYGQDIAQRDEKRTQPVISAKNAPEGCPEFTSAYLGRPVRVAGSEWHYQGVSNVPSSSDGPAPDPGCVCYNSHLSADPYGRVYAVNTFAFTVNMLDTGGNLITRIGSYGNADSAGPKSAVPTPEIALACPNDVSYAAEKLYICDSVNRRVVVVRFDYDVEKKLAVE